MQEILQDIANKLTYVPAWVTYVGIFVPIFVSIVVLISQIVQSRINKNLQKNIHRHQVDLKRFDSILEIYFVFSESVDALSYNADNIMMTLSDQKSKVEWHNRLVDVERKLYRKYDFALMLLGGEIDLVKILKEKADKYCELVNSILIDTQNEMTCIEEIANNIAQMSKEYIDLMSYDEFDKYFSDYLKINRFTEI